MLRLATTCATAALLLALTPQQAGAQQGRQDETPPEQSSAIAVPEERINQAVAKLDELAQETLARTGIPGLAIAVVHGRDTLYAKGFGIRKAGAQERVDADTVFQLASVSKSIGATVVAAEVGKGKIQWNTPVARDLPWFTLTDPWVGQHVTVGDLYAHRSGLPDHAGDDLEIVGFDRRQILERLRWLPLDAFRAHYAYTNFGLVAAADAVAAAAGRDWADLSQEDLYLPLGMAATSSRHADFLKRTNRAAAHVRTAEGFKPLYTRAPDAQSAAGGVSSSANDMAKWMGMILNEGKYQGRSVIPGDALLPALTPQAVMQQPGSASTRAAFYGYGFVVSTRASGRTMLMHSGAFEAGAATTFVMIPSLKLGIVVLSNAYPIGAVEALAMNFADLAEYGRETQDWARRYTELTAPLTKPFGALAGAKPPAHPQPQLRPQAYAGTYFNDYFGRVEVAVRAGQLALTIGPEKKTVALKHWDGNRFVFDVPPPDSAAGSRSAVDFEPDDAGRITAMHVELLGQDGQGDFVRR